MDSMHNLATNPNFSLTNRKTPVMLNRSVVACHKGVSEMRRCSV